MPNKKMQFPKLAELQDENLTPWQRFERLAKRVVAVPKEAIRQPTKDNPKAS